MKSMKRLFVILYVTLLPILLSACEGREQSQAAAALRSQLDALSKTDSPLIFHDFKYEISDLKLDQNKQHAVADLKLCTIDGHALAKDFLMQHLQEELLAACSPSADPSHFSDLDQSQSTSANHYEILSDLLKENQYQTIECETAVSMVKTSDWEIELTSTFEDDLVGGFLTALHDTDIISPSETLSVYLNVLTEMDQEQLICYLGLEDLRNANDSINQETIEALTSQIQKHFSYKLLSEDRLSDTSASVEALITTFDSSTILNTFQAELDAYLATPEAVTDGMTGRSDTSFQILHDVIRDNTDTVENTAEFHLTHDGVSWKLDDDYTSLGNALLGSFFE